MRYSKACDKVAMQHITSLVCLSQGNGLSPMIHRALLSQRNNWGRSNLPESILEVGQTHGRRKVGLDRIEKNRKTLVLQRMHTTHVNNELANPYGYIGWGQSVLYNKIKRTRIAS